MKKDPKKTSKGRHQTSAPLAGESSSKSPKTEFPLSEKDEVKQAEERLRLKNKPKE